MNLAHPYGQGNHRRIAWRRGWDVDLIAMEAVHRATGFVLVFYRMPDGMGLEMKVQAHLPVFGVTDADFIAQVQGLKELLADGWDIFHTALARVERDREAGLVR